MMNWKKNGYNCFIWLIYTVAVGFGLFCVVSYWGNTWGYSLPIYIVATAFILLVLCGVVYLLYRFTGGLAEALRKRKPLAISLEVTFILALIATGILFTLKIPQGSVESVYYELAFVEGEAGIPKMIHGAVYLYVQFLHVICVLFGNEVLFCVWAQFVLYLLTALVIYVAVRRLAGVIPALITLSFFMFSETFYAESIKLSPNILFLLLFGVALHMIITCIKSDAFSAPLYVITGITIGVMVYLDILGALLLFLLAAAENKLLKRFVLYLSAIVATAAGFFGCILIDAFTCGKPFVSILKAWYELFLPEKWSLPVSVAIGNSEIDVILLFVGLAVGIFSFFCNSTERLGVVFVPFTALMIAQVFGMVTGEMDGSLLLYLFAVILCGVGVGNIYTPCKKDEPEELLDEAFPMIQDLDTLENEPEPETTPTPETKPETENISKQEEEAEPLAESVSESVETIPEVQVQYLENPLPVPKKHVPKVLDYDIEVPDDDDYDI